MMGFEDIVYRLVTNQQPVAELLQNARELLSEDEVIILKSLVADPAALQRLCSATVAVPDDSPWYPQSSI